MLITSRISLKMLWISIPSQKGQLTAAIQEKKEGKKEVKMMMKKMTWIQFQLFQNDHLVGL